MTMIWGRNSSDKDEVTVISTKKIRWTSDGEDKKNFNPCDNETGRDISDIFMAQYQTVYWSTGEVL